MDGSPLTLSNVFAQITAPAASVTISGGGKSRVIAINSGVTASISGLTITGGSTAASGGGIYDKGTVTLTNCTVAGNSAGSVGGGIENLGTATLTNCTVAGNSASSEGGGIYSKGTATLTNCTVAGNSAQTAGGILNFGTMNIGNTIVATNTATNGPDVAGGVTSKGHNLIGKIDGSSGWLASDLTGTIASPKNPLLAALGSYGGPTDAMALLPHSPAIGAGSGSGITTDQRGFALDSPPDIGAFQTQTNPLLVVNTTVDGNGSPFGDLSLRQAVNLANLQGAAESISFNATVFATAQTITLLGSQLTLSDAGGTQTITGPTAGVTISGGGTSSVLGINSGVTASISRLTITDGSTTASGGGILNDGTVTITNCTVAGNSAEFGGGIFNGNGTTTLTGTTVADNSAALGGGGLFSQGTATLSDSTFSGNTAGGSSTRGYGGGILTQSQNLLSLTDCTIASNTASISGGGIEAQGPVTITSCTFTANQASPTSGGGGGGAIDNPNGGEYTITIEDSILSGDSCGYGPEVANAAISHGYNLISNTANSSGWISSDIIGQGADLGSLGNDGGPTQTIPILPGSPAIGKGSSVAGATTDQRGLIRGTTVDIGAFQTSLVVESTLGSALESASVLTLPGAVSLADAYPGPIAISFDPVVFASTQTISGVGTLTLDNTGGLQTITGPAAGVIVSGGGPIETFQIGQTLGPATTVSISGLTITGGHFSGIIVNLFSAVTLTNCTVSGNTAPFWGGGIDNEGTATIIDCTVAANSAGYGGGIYNEGTATLTNCTISGNSAKSTNGGGIYNEGTVTLTNCTVAGNSASTDGGGIYNRSTATLTNCTVAGNSASSGGGIFNGGFKVTIGNTIVATNTATTGPDVDGTFTSKGYNLIGKTDGSTGFTATGDKTGTKASPLNPKLGTLGNYGGPTQTIPILSGSPAIGKGSNSLAGLTVPTTDQRGFALDSPSPDIGAWQTNTLLVVNTTTGATVTPFGDLSLPLAVELADLRAPPRRSRSIRQSSPRPRQSPWAAPRSRSAAPPVPRRSRARQRA